MQPTSVLTNQVFGDTLLSIASANQFGDYWLICQRSTDSSRSVLGSYLFVNRLIFGQGEDTLRLDTLEAWLQTTDAVQWTFGDLRLANEMHLWLRTMCWTDSTNGIAFLSFNGNVTGTDYNLGLDVFWHSQKGFIQGFDFDNQVFTYPYIDRGYYYGVKQGFDPEKGIVTPYRVPGGVSGEPFSVQALPTGLPLVSWMKSPTNQDYATVTVLDSAVQILAQWDAKPRPTPMAGDFLPPCLFHKDETQLYCWLGDSAWLRLSASDFRRLDTIHTGQLPAKFAKAAQLKW